MDISSTWDAMIAFQKSKHNIIQILESQLNLNREELKQIDQWIKDNCPHTNLQHLEYKDDYTNEVFAYSNWCRSCNEIFDYKLVKIGRAHV